MHRTTDLLVSLLILVAYAAFSVWTVRRVLLAPQRDPSTRFGMRVFAPLMWVATTVIWTIGDRFPSNLVLRVLLNAFWMLPLSLWSGYGAGRQMRRFLRGTGGEPR
jgi:hypothetical protein